MEFNFNQAEVLKWFKEIQIDLAKKLYFRLNYKYDFEVCYRVIKLIYTYKFCYLIKENDNVSFIKCLISTRDIIEGQHLIILIAEDLIKKMNDISDNNRWIQERDYCFYNKNEGPINIRDVMLLPYAFFVNSYFKEFIEFKSKHCEELNYLYKSEITFDYGKFTDFVTKFKTRDVNVISSALKALKLCCLDHSKMNYRRYILLLSSK